MNRGGLDNFGGNRLPRGRGSSDLPPREEWARSSNSEVAIVAPISVLALAMAVRVNPRLVLDAAFLELGRDAINENSILDGETAQLIASHLGVMLVIREES